LRCFRIGNIKTVVQTIKSFKNECQIENLKIKATLQEKIGSTHFDKTLQKEKGGSTKDRYWESFPGLPDPVIGLHLSRNPEGLRNKLYSPF
jgi:hypothetical protein